MILSQNKLFDFLGSDAVKELLELMSLVGKKNMDVKRQNALETKLKTWLKEKHKAALEKVLFIDFALCQIEDASNKFFFIGNIKNENGLKEAYKSIIQDLVDNNNGVAINYNFTSALDIHDNMDYPLFSGVYLCPDIEKRNADIPPCLKPYSEKLRGLKKYGLKSWCAMPVNTPSPTGLYNLAQIFIGFKQETELDMESAEAKAIRDMIKDFILFIHYLSHWRSGEISIIENLYKIGGEKGSEDAKEKQNRNQSHFQEEFENRMKLFFMQFKNLLLVRIVMMPSVDSKNTQGYNFVLSREKDQVANKASLEAVLRDFNEARVNASKDNKSVSRGARNARRPRKTFFLRQYTTSLIPFPGNCLPQYKERALSNGTNANWNDCWKNWKNLRNHKGTNNATMIFIPAFLGKDKDNESYVYAEFLGKKADIQKQLDLFRKGVSSVVKNTINYLMIYEKNEKHFQQMEKLYADLIEKTSDVDDLARIFALGFNAFDDMEWFRNNFGFISFYFFDKDYKNNSFVLVPKNNQDNGEKQYLYSNYQIYKSKNEPSQGTEPYPFRKEFSDNSNRETKNCLNALSSAWKTNPSTEHSFNDILFFDIDESVKSVQHSDYSRQYVNAFSSIIDEQSISLSIVKSNISLIPRKKIWSKVENLEKSTIAVETPEGNDSAEYQAYYMTDDEATCAVVVFLRKHNETIEPAGVLIIGLRSGTFSISESNKIHGIIKGLWKHQLYYLFRKLEHEKQIKSMDDICKKLNAFLNSKDMNLYTHDNCKQLPFGRTFGVQVDEESLKTLFILFDHENKTIDNEGELYCHDEYGLWYRPNKRCIDNLCLESIISAFSRQLSCNIKIVVDKSVRGAVSIPYPGIIFLLNLYAFIYHLYCELKDNHKNQIDLKLMKDDKNKIYYIDLPGKIATKSYFDPAGVYAAIYDRSKDGNVRNSACRLILLQPPKLLDFYSDKKISNNKDVNSSKTESISVPVSAIKYQKETESLRVIWREWK